MAKLMSNLADLVKVKTLVTLTVLIVWAVLALTGRVTDDHINTIVLMVISFYFGTQHERHRPPVKGAE